LILEVVIGRDVSITLLLLSLHSLLLLLSELGSGKLGLLLLGHNLVAHGVELLLLVTLLLSKSGTRSLTRDPVVAGRSHDTIHNGPDLLGKILGELGGMGNDDNTTLESLDSSRQSSKRVSIQIVGRLIKDDKMGSLPGTGGKHKLDLLTTRQTSDSRVRDKLGLETKEGAVGLNLLLGKRSELSGSKGLLHINLSNQLGVGLHELGSGDPGVVDGTHGDPLLGLHAKVLTEQERTLVLVRVLELSSGVNTSNSSGGALDLVDLVHGSLIGVGDLSVGSVHGLSILTGLESPLDVLRGGGVKMGVDMGKGVLLDVSNSTVLVGVNLTGGGEQLTGQDVDKSGLTSTVGTDNGNSRRQRALERDVSDLGLGGTGVLEGHVLDLDNSLLLGLDTLEETGLGEREVNLGGSKLVVRLGGRNLLDKLGQVTLVLSELESLVVNDVLTDVIEETRVVGDDDGGDTTGVKVVDQPSNVDGIQMVGRLIKQQDIGLSEDGSGKSQLHLPSTRQRGDGHSGHLVSEQEVKQLLSDLLLSTDGLTGGLSDVVDNVGVGVGTVNVVVDEDSSTLLLGGETLDLTVGNGSHQGGLTSTVRTTETVSSASLESQLGSVQQNLSTVSQRELTVTQILALVVLLLKVGGTGDVGDGLLSERLNDGSSILLGENGNHEGNQRLGPVGLVGETLVNEVTGDGGNELHHEAELLGVDLEGLEQLLEDGKVDLGVTGGGNLGDLVVNNLTNSLQGVESSQSNVSSLGVGNVGVVSLESGVKGLKEGSNNLGVVDQLTHVIDNDGGLSLDGGVSLSKTSGQQRSHDGEGGGGDLGHKGGGTENVHSLGDLGGLGDTGNQGGDELDDILVVNGVGGLGDGGGGLLLDLLLGVPHGLGEDGDELGHSQGNLVSGNGDQDGNALESSNLLGPLVGVNKRLDDQGQNELDGSRSDALSNILGGLGGGVLDLLVLVTDLGEHISDGLNKVGLHVGGNGGGGGKRVEQLQSVENGSLVLLLVQLGLGGSQQLVRNIVLNHVALVNKGGNVVGSLKSRLQRVADRELLKELRERLVRNGGFLLSTHGHK
jgi:hypothetical protein